MALSATLQSSVAGPLLRIGSRVLPPAYLIPRRGLQVRCQAEEKPSEQPEQPASIKRPDQPSPNPLPNPTPAIKPKTKVSTKFSDVLAFSGPAPERINGRLAMIGFVSALAVEAARGDDLMAQLMNGGLLWFLGTTAVFSVASLVPLFMGVSVQSKSEGLMNSDAELWNGRFAMLGLVALALTEYFKGGPLV